MWALPSFAWNIHKGILQVEQLIPSERWSECLKSLRERSLRVCRNRWSGGIYACSIMLIWTCDQVPSKTYFNCRDVLLIIQGCLYVCQKNWTAETGSTGVNQFIPSLLPSFPFKNIFIWGNPLLLLIGGRGTLFCFIQKHPFYLLYPVPPPPTFFTF